MTTSEAERVVFEILLRAPGSGGIPSLDTIAQHRPDPGAIEVCRRVLAAGGVTCHPTDFGLVCDAPREVFESLFRVKLGRIHDRQPARPAWVVEEEPRPPEAIASYVDQVTISSEPEFFG